MKGLGTLGFVVLAGCGFLAPAAGSWAFALAEFAFLAWLAREIRRTDRAALAGRARAPLEPDEAEIVGRYAFYFSRPAMSRECASVLAGIGLASLVLVPWFTYKLQLAPAVLIGVQLFAVARLTKHLSPVYALRLAAAKGDRESLRLLSAHDGAVRKLSAPEEPGA